MAEPGFCPGWGLAIREAFPVGSGEGDRGLGGRFGGVGLGRPCLTYRVQIAWEPPLTP